MAVRTAQWLKDQWIQRPGVDWVDDLLDTVLNTTDLGTAGPLWVDASNGDDTSGNGSKIRPYASITQALASVSASRTSIIILPGTYQERVVWPSRNNVRLVGIGQVTIDDPSAGGTSVVTVYPAVKTTASWSAYIEGVDIDHNGTGVYLDNSSAIGTFALRLANVKFVRGGGTSLITNHGTNNPVVLDFEHVDFAGKVKLSVRDPNDAMTLYNGKLSRGLVTTGSPALGGTVELTFANAEVLHEGVSGGSANQLVNSLNSWSRTGSTLAAVDTNDLAGDHSENIV